jgi:hypothetical protein
MNEQSISFRFGVSAAPTAVTVGHWFADRIDPESCADNQH